MRQHPVSHGPAIGRIGVLAIEGGNADTVIRQQGRVDELRYIRHALHTARSVGQCDQTVSLAAAVGRVETEDRRDLAARARQPPTHISQQALEASRGIGVGEKTRRIQIFLASLPGDDLREVRREVGLGDPTIQNIAAWPASLVYRGNHHLLRFVSFCSSAAPKCASTLEREFNRLILPGVNPEEQGQVSSFVSGWIGRVLILSSFCLDHPEAPSVVARLWQ